MNAQSLAVSQQCYIVRSSFAESYAELGHGAEGDTILNQDTQSPQVVSVETLLETVHWPSSPLGPRAAWPDCLHSAIDIMVPSDAQIVMFWGPEYVALYNDIYAPTIGDKHPHAFGQPAREYWTELWDDLEPLLDRVLHNGETVSAKDRPFYIERHGYPETVYFVIFSRSGP